MLPSEGQDLLPRQLDPAELEASILRLIGAVLLEANDEWQLQHRSMQLEAMAELTPPAADVELAQISPQAA